MRFFLAGTWAQRRIRLRSLGREFQDALPEFAKIAVPLMLRIISLDLLSGEVHRDGCKAALYVIGQDCFFANAVGILRVKKVKKGEISKYYY